MQTKLNITKVSELPLVLAPDTLYITVDPNNSGRSIFTMTSSLQEGDDITSHSTNSVADIQALIQDALNPPQPNGVTTKVVTHHLPDVGNTCDVVLDGVIRIHYEKTTNGGYEGYKVSLFSVGPDRTIGFRRDTIFDTVSLEGANGNDIVLNEVTPYVSDTLSYGSMREFTRKFIVDYQTMVSWQIDIIGFGNGYLRFIIERQTDS